MECYNDKSKEELISVIQNLEKQLQGVKSKWVSSENAKFREKYSTQVLGALTDMLIVFDHQGVVVEMISDPRTNHIHHTSHNMRNTLLEELIEPEACLSLRKTMQKVLTNGKAAVGEHSMVIDGVRRYFEHTISPLDNDHLLCANRDISKRVRAYKELETLKCALSNAKEGILATTLNGQLFFANERIVSEFRLLGDVKNYNICDLVDQNTIVQWNNMITDIRRENSSMRYLIPKSLNGEEQGTYEVFANILLNESGEEILWCFVRDVSLRLKQQNEIARLHTILNAVLNNIPVYLFVKDVNNDFRYLYWNNAFAIHSGIPTKEAIGRNDFELFHESERMRRFRQEDIDVLKKGRIEYEEETITAKGERRMMITVKTAIYQEAETPYIVGVSWDTTEIRQAEKKLIEARNKAEEADKLKSSFLANMSHEIRTPLNAIVGFAKLAIDAKDDEERWSYIDVVDKNSAMLLNLFNDILDLSAIESDSLYLFPRPVILHELCSDQYELHRHTTQYGVKLILDEVDRELWISADWDRLGQILSNLLKNAVKFTQKGEVRYGFERKEDVVQFYVKDTGIGISSEKIANIFQRFGKVNNFVQGTGLGLAISRLIVEKMGGRIWVRSKQGAGTTFYFTIPFSQDIL